MNLGLLRLRFILAIIALSLCLSANAIPSQQRIYISGEKGYDTYRIPALLMTGNGTVLAFCEGRKGKVSSGLYE